MSDQDLTCRERFGGGDEQSWCQKCRSARGAGYTCERVRRKGISEGDRATMRTRTSGLILQARNDIQKLIDSVRAGGNEAEDTRVTMAIISVLDEAARYAAMVNDAPTQTAVSVLKNCLWNIETMVLLNVKIGAEAPKKGTVTP